MTLPPWLRAIQQTWSFHIVQAAVCGAGVAMFACFALHNEFSMACVDTGLIAAGVTFFASTQHSPGSASFKPDGEVNQPVKQAVEMQAAGIPVKVVKANL